jgi:hypothetical protein
LLPHPSEEFRNGAKPFRKRAESMLVTSRRRLIVGNWRCSICRYASAIFITLGFAVCCMSSDAYAGGVHFGFGIDVPPPGYAVAPPEVVYPPPVVVERRPPPPPVVVERTPPPPPVVVERTPPVVYEGPVVVERRSVYYYYRPSYHYHSYYVETGRDCYGQRSLEWEDDVEY